MDKMSEIDMMVREVVERVENDGIYLSSAMPIIAAEWALDSDEFDMVYQEAYKKIYA
jgi:hypothetical protein